MRAAYRSLLIGPITAGAVIAALVNPGLAGAAPDAVTAASAGSPRSNVIVLLKDQHTTSARTTALRARHTQTLHASQAGVVSAAKKLGGRDIHQFGLVNAVSVNLSAASAKALAAQPDVAAVVPDLPIQRPATTLDQAVKKAAAPAAPPEAAAGACTTNPAKPLLEPEALQTMHVAFNNATPGANALSTGAGVKVGFIANGLDINNPDFIRNGKSVFVDHQDFTSEGWDAPSDATEAFGDASSIGAQGNQTYDLANFVNTSHPLPTGCTIRIQGVAPGADLVGLKVFGNAPTAPTSRFIQAIEYAVNVDNVDVINESFGSNPYPDSQDDPITLADRAAVNAGVTVVASTGDSGVTSTIGSPASDPKVIGVGATTQFRLYAQTASSGYNLPGVKSWASDNISAISSAGFAQNGKIPDLVAPGDLGWALCSANVAVYEGCINYNGKPSAILDFGGTSQSSPLTAGAAALVISAYEKAHPGAAKPSPSLVKRLLTSTARDLGHPAQLQGAGEVDALAAVKAAMSVPTESAARPKLALGTALLVDKSQLDLSATAGSSTTAKVKVTNLSARTQTVKASTRSLTKTLSSTTGTINFDGASLPTFPNVVGTARAYVAKKFTVKPGADRLDVDTAFGSYPLPVFTALVDPHGVFQAYSLPQGAANFADVSVRYPSAGKWTAYIFANPTFSGKVSYNIKTSAYTTLGSVTPSVTIAAGKSATLTYKVPVPKNPGDTAASIQLRTALGVTSSVPVSLRGTITASKTSVKSFKGVVTGGNGRVDGGVAQTNTYYLDVPKKAPSLSVGIKLTGQVSPNAFYYGYLVAPNGQPLSAPSNIRIYGGDLVAVPGLQLYANAPAAGRWKLVMEATNPIAGNLVSQPFAGTVSLAAQPVTVKPLLPTSAKVKLTAGKTVLLKVKVTNSGVVPMTYFADARLKNYGTYNLASQVPGDDLSSVDLPESLVTGAWLVPTHTYSLSFGADATEPVQLDAGWYNGGPDVFGDSVGNKSTALATSTKLAPGPWYASAGVVGPFVGPAPDGKVAYTATAKTRKFDPAVETSTGDLWKTAFIPAPPGELPVSPQQPVSAGSHWASALHRQATSQKVAAVAALAESGPLTLAPGKSGTITVAITPPASAKGKVTTGTLYIDTVDLWLGTGDEVAGFAYTYTVKK